MNLIMAYRCMITKEKSKYYIGKDYSGNKYKIIKNKYIRCRVGDDFYFYAKKQAGFFTDILIPISSKEAGVVD